MKGVVRIAVQAGLALALLAGCGPMSPEAAALQCEERARAADGPTGEFGIGIGSDGVKSKIEIGITSDYIAGRDPYAVYDQCVRQLTGQGPIRPLVL